MKYIITGKNLKAGIVGEDSADLQQYFELGWEIIVTRMRAIHLLKTGEISKDDCIVTIPDRACLYSSLFKNTLDYREYYQNENINKDDSYDLVKICNRIFPPMTSSYHYSYETEEKNELLSFDYKIPETLKPTKPFCVILARLRTHCENRNVAIDYWDPLIEELKNRGIDVYLFGRGAEQIIAKHKIPHINIQGWISLMQHPLCRATIGTMSGALLLGQLCSTNKLIVIDNLAFRKNVGEHHPLFFANHFNFINVPTTYFYHLPTSQEILTHVL